MYHLKQGRSVILLAAAAELAIPRARIATINSTCGHYSCAKLRAVESSQDNQ
jgi:hypothetical protein